MPARKPNAIIFNSSRKFHDMNSKHLRLLVLILLLLLAGIFLQKAQKPRQTVPSETASLVPNLAPSRITEIRLKKGDGPEIRIAKKDGEWQVENLWGSRADGKKIEGFLALIADLKGELRTNDSALFADFGIRDDEGLHLIFLEGSSKKTHLVIGVRSSRLKEIFVRHALASAVYAASTDLLLNLGIYNDLKDAQLDANTWADLSFFSVPREQIDRIEIKEGTADWREPGSSLPFEKDPRKIEEYLEGLLSAKASGISDPQGGDYGFAAPFWEIRLTLKDGTSRSLLAGSKKEDDGGSRYFKRSDAATVYFAPDSVLRRIKSDESRFIRNNPLGIETPERVNRISIKTAQENISLIPAREPRKGLKNYLEVLKTFRVLRLPDPRAKTQKQKRGESRLEIEVEGKPLVSISCNAPEGEKAKESVCVNEANGIPFMVSEMTFGALFEDLADLKEGAPEPPSGTEPRVKTE